MWVNYRDQRRNKVATTTPQVYFIKVRDETYVMMATTRTKHVIYSKTLLTS